MLPTGGDGSAWIKYSDGSWNIATGDTARVTVGSPGTTINKVTTTGDANVGGNLRVVGTTVLTGALTTVGATVVAGGSTITGALTASVLLGPVAVSGVLNVTSDEIVGGTLTVVGDFDAAGGNRHQYRFYHSGTQADTGNLMSVGQDGNFRFTELMLFGPGSIRKFSLSSPDSIVAGGAITASIHVMGLGATSASIALVSGNYASAATFDKDSVGNTFSNLWSIQVALTASSFYTSSLGPSGYSGSWMAQVEVES